MLCSMKELLDAAERQDRAVGAFSVYSMETVKGAVAAAEQMGTPIILQIAESRFPYAPLELMAPMMLGAARTAQVPVAVHLDHGVHMETIKQALDYGFTSVMLDASAYPLEDNIRMTKVVLKLARAYHAAVEAEAMKGWVIWRTAIQSRRRRSGSPGRPGWTPWLWPSGMPMEIIGGPPVSSFRS